MADQINGLGLDQAQIADAINRQKLGSQRQKNEMMRLGTTDPNSFIAQNKQFLQQPQQPSGLGSMFSEPPPVPTPQPDSYSPRSITDLQAASAPPDSRTSLQKLFGSGGDSEYAMPQNQADNYQKNLANTLKQLNPDTYSKTAFVGTDTNWLAENSKSLLNRPLDDVTNAQVFGAYSPMAHQEDPIVKSLNSKYKFAGRGWDLGDGMFYSPKKGNQGNSWKNNLVGNSEMDAPTFSQKIEEGWADAFTQEGKFDPEGWYVNKPDYDGIARRGILGTLSVLAPAIFAGLGTIGTAAGEGASTAAAAGSSTAIPAGSEGLMTGALATEAAPAAAGSSTGMFGNSNLDFGNMWLNRAGEGAVKGAITSGGDPKSTLAGVVTGGMSPALNSGLSSFGKYLTEQGLPSNVVSSITDFTSGAGTSLVKNLFGKNTGQGMLQSALTSGVGKTLGGIYNQNAGVTDRQHQMQNYGTAQTLAQLFRKVL